MDERQRIIAGACLKHSDTGEASFDMEARRILQALEDNGYEVVKNISSKQGVIKSVCEHKSEDLTPHDDIYATCKCGKIIAGYK